MVGGWEERESKTLFGQERGCEMGEEVESPRVCRPQVAEDASGEGYTRSAELF